MLSFTGDQSKVSLLSLVALTSKLQQQKIWAQSFSLLVHTDVTISKSDVGWNEQILPVFTACVWQQAEVLQ